MKKVIVVLLAVILLFSVGCVRAPYFAYFYTLELENDTENSFPEGYRNRIREDISDESYEMLLEIYDIYGIEIRFHKPFSFGFLDDIKTVDLPKSRYDVCISEVYKMLKLLGDDRPTAGVIDEVLNSIYIVHSVSTDGIKQSSYPFDNGLLILDILSDATLRRHYYKEDITDALACLLYINYNLYDYEFGRFKSNGFVGYDNEVSNDKNKYLNIIESRHIYGDSQISEFLEAGFLNIASTRNIQTDFKYYFKGLMENQDDFWAAYGVYPVVKSKADVVVDFLTDINPKWTLEYFIEKSHPDGLDAFSEPEIAEVNPYEKYIGVYERTYQNNSGEMNVEIKIISISSDIGDIHAKFIYSPGKGNKTAKSGEYYMTGNIALNSGEFYLNGSEWITEKPAKYDMFDLTGTITGNHFIAKIDRDYLQDFVLTRSEE